MVAREHNHHWPAGRGRRANAGDTRQVDGNFLKPPQRPGGMARVAHRARASSMAPTSSGGTAENTWEPKSATTSIQKPVDEPDQHEQANRGKLYPVGQPDGRFDVTGLRARAGAEKRAAFGLSLVTEGSA